ncbi:hypothetical protein RJ641_010912 [Dillenia turbinata]|uniref:Uncharacterized protein n=1 Tax=Dillenia turbinata TaxID=194707 RepID=A0AAN8Z6R7_9MAGN
MKSHLCIPRLVRSSTCTPSNKLSFLERFRQAVFRLIMWSALSKATHQSTPTKSPSNNVKCRSRYAPDPHHNEAVADCIEFIKKSALSDDGRDSTSSSSIDVTPQHEMVMPVPVM